MKKLFLVSTMCLMVIALQAQNINGRIIDENAQPLPFANVVLLSLPDSTFVQGAVSDAEGLFSIKTEKTHGLLKVSSIGYVTQFINCQGGNMGDITLTSDQKMLNEVEIKASRPTYKMTTEGIATNVENTVLSQAGTAEDVLAKIPGLTKKGEDFEVFGKGAPLIYINGREVHDLSELDQLKSEDIKSVEVITNPGAKYDASVKSVVIIRTKKPQGEGFGFDVRSSYYQSENTDLVEQLNWNYRNGKLDVFGTLHYSLTNIRWQSTTTTIVPADTLWEQLFTQDNRVKSQASRNVIGANYTFNENHSIGFRYNFTLRPNRLQTPWSSSDITANGSQTAVHSAVGKLDIGKGSRIVDPAGTLGQALADAEGIQLELFIVRFAGRGVRNGFTVGNYRAAAFGFFFQIRSHLRGHMTFGGDHAGACRCGNDPVFQSQVPDPDRGKKVRVQFLTRVFLGHDRSSSIHVSNRTYCLLVHYRKTASAM